MKKSTVAAVAVIAITLGGISWAQAQPPGFYGPYGGYPGYGYQQPVPPPGYGPHFGGPQFGEMAPFMGDYTDMLEERFDWIEDRLDITADQKGAFNAFRDKVLAVMEGQREMHKAFRKDRPKDPVEMDQRRIAMMQQRLTGMKEIAEARKDLFAVLTKDQREEAAEVMMHRGRRGDRRAPDWYWGY